MRNKKSRTKSSLNIALPDSRDLVSSMCNRGMPKSVMRIRPFILSEYLSSIESDIPGQNIKRVTRERQEEQFRTLYRAPQVKPYLAVISSAPNDQKALLVAAQLFRRGIQGHVDGTVRQRNRTLPLWHMITGSWYDKLRDQYDKPRTEISPIPPSLMVFSNITTECSQAKLEKLRDLIEIYNDVPRIIVLTGSGSGVDGITFANSRLHCPVTYAIHLATARRLEI